MTLILTNNNAIIILREASKQKFIGSKPICRYILDNQIVLLLYSHSEILPYSQELASYLYSD